MPSYVYCCLHAIIQACSKTGQSDVQLVALHMYDTAGQQQQQRQQKSPMVAGISQLLTACTVLIAHVAGDAGCKSCAGGAGPA